MKATLKTIRAKNYRCIRDVSVACVPINVLFGPNGVGKTTFLDALWFLRDCAIRGTEQAASDRHHGIGVLWDGCGEDDRMEITLETAAVRYTVSFGFSAGRIEPFVGEKLVSTVRGLDLVDRKVGSAEAVFYHEQLGQTMSIGKLRDPQKLALSNYLLFCQPGPETSDLDDLLHAIHYYHSRAPNFYQLRKFGAESSQHTFLWDRWQNLWSALRNLQGRRALDQRYDQIIAFMRKAFPRAFRDLVIEPLGPDRVYASFIEEGRRNPIQASGVSDGHIQLLGLLTALFGDQQNRGSVIIFDEPEASLHPHALAVFGEAVQEAATNWNRQVFMATHSPVLMSQFPVESALVFEMGDARETQVVRLAHKAELRDLLDQYALGSLYMAEAVAPQAEVAQTS
ncbi:MAG TPA: AAA family ATPase [Pirellulales bacterium]|nr:AAA family ATPase [Pirellulales bacterium]